MRHMMIAALLLGTSPAAAQSTPAAQPSPAAPPAAAAPTSVDPARVAAAAPIAARLWPIGTYRRMMSSTMNGMMDRIMVSMMGMKASDVAGAAASAQDGEAATATGDKTLGELAAAADPDFAERMRLSTRVMYDEMGTLMQRFEPQVQQAVAHGLARRFDTDELAELRRFFDTPVGRRYAADAMLLPMEPEMVDAMAAFLPEFVKAMPAIQKKVEAATAHLPPPPKSATDTADAGDDE